MVNFVNNTLTALFVVVIFSIISIPSTSIAQTVTEEDRLETQAVIKMSGISPAVGASFQIDDNSKLRALAYISINSLGTNDNYLLDLSYLRNIDWLDSEEINSYLGVNLNIQFDNFHCWSWFIGWIFMPIE